jgi:hypothetical protein
VASSLTRGWLCRLQLLLVLASAFILRFESRMIHDHSLLSHIRDSPNLEARSPYLYPSGTGWPRALDLFPSPFTTCRVRVEAIRTLLHTLEGQSASLDEKIRGGPNSKHRPQQCLHFWRSYSLPQVWTGRVESSLMLRPTVSRPVGPERKHPSGAHDQISTPDWQPRARRCGAPPPRPRQEDGSATHSRCRS